MDILKAPVGTQKFVKSQTIDIFNATTQTLVGACQYVIGLVYLLSGDKKNAYALLSRIRNTVLVEYHDGLGMNVLKKLTDDRLFITLAQFAIEHMRNFKKDKNSHHLRNMCSVLEEANAIRPDTYFYNLNMAYAHVILNQNALLAKACIEKCKQLKQEKDWLYSDAFLSAYCGHAPGTILSKYKKAFSVPYEDLIEIVDYIEFVIEHQPQKNALHLAAGLVYEEIGDYTLMKQHLAIFMNESKELDRRIQSAIQQKMLASCNTSCDNNCFSCKRSPAA